MTSEEVILNLADTMQESHSEALRELRAEKNSKQVEIDQFKPAKLDRSRLEGCEMCNRKYSPPEWNGGGSHDFRVDRNALFYHDSKYGWEGIEIKFCPMCARPLTEEAWEELERRINGGTTD